MRNCPIYIIGGRLAGSEAAWQVARAGESYTGQYLAPNLKTGTRANGQKAKKRA